MDEKLLTMQLGKAIERLRQQEGLSQEKLSLMTGISRQYLIKIEHGMANPTVELLHRIAGGLGISIARIMNEAEMGGSPLLPGRR